MNIEQQIPIADELLGALETICPHVILAGGAPRDWYMGNTCNDLDFYVSFAEGLTSSVCVKMIHKALPEGVKVVKKPFESHTDPIYKHMKGLRKIHYLEYKGVEFQLIQLHSVKDVYQAVNKMSCSICKIWYKFGKIIPEKDFKITMKSEVMYLNDDYSWDDYHPKKMSERFKGKYHIGTEEQAKSIIINKCLKEL